MFLITFPFFTLRPLHSLPSLPVLTRASASNCRCYTVTSTFLHHGHQEGIFFSTLYFRQVAPDRLANALHISMEVRVLLQYRPSDCNSDAIKVLSIGELRLEACCNIGLAVVTVAELTWYAIVK